MMLTSWTVGVLTQCVQVDKFYNKRNNDQYWNNVALKFVISMLEIIDNVVNDNDQQDQWPFARSELVRQ